MRKLIFLRQCQITAIFVGLLGVLPWSASATVQINITAGNLLGKGGTSTLATSTTPTSTSGSLLLLVAANQTSNTFTNQLSAGQYVAGGDTILASFAFNNFAGAGGGNQTTTNSLNFTLPSTVTGGTTLVQLRWFPSITLANYQSNVTTTNGTTYGVYNPGLYPTLNGTSLAPDGGNNWVVPADNTSGYALDFYTTNTGFAGAKQATAEGYAFLTVPEPSAGILGGLALVVTIGATRVWRRSLAA